MTQKAYVTNGYLSDIASAIRYKNGQSSTYLPFEMASAIRDIPAGPTPTGQIEITENGTYDVSSYASANVEVGSDFVINDTTALFYTGARIDEINKYMNALSQAPLGGYCMFSGCSSLTSLDLSNLNTINFTNMSNMFGSCSSLTSLNLSSFNTTNVDNMSVMFSNCSSLTNLDVSNFDTRNVTTMVNMFYKSSALTSLDLSNFNTANVTNMGGMFSGCSSLTSLDLSNLNTANVTNMYSMFNNCSSLTSLKIGANNSNYSNVNNTSSIFAGCSNLDSITINGTTVLPITASNAFTNLKSTCKFYVPSNLLSQYKSATNWSTRAKYIYAIS